MADKDRQAGSFNPLSWFNFANKHPDGSAGAAAAV